MGEVSKEWKEIRNEFGKSRSSVDVYIDDALKDDPKVEYNYEHGIMASLVDINTDNIKAIKELENSGLILPCSDVCHEIIVSVNEADQVVARGNSTLINEKIDALSQKLRTYMHRRWAIIKIGSPKKLLDFRKMLTKNVCKDIMTG